ncbi:MAG: ferritin-like fold-containing protein [Propionibacteriaceae bacterium]
MSDPAEELAVVDEASSADAIVRDDAAALASDPEYRQGAVDLLGILAYGELTAFERLAEDGRLAPTLADKVHMATLASQQIEHFGRVRSRLGDLGVDVMVAMRPFHVPFNSYHEYTKPKDWLEGLIKAYVGDGFANDFYREVAAFVDPVTRALVYDVLSDQSHADYVVQKVVAAIDADRRVAGRLALWGRRLVGEALSQAQRVAAERDALTSLLTGTVDRPGMDLAAISRMFSRLIETHTKRMAKLGLQA